MKRIPSIAKDAITKPSNTVHPHLSSSQHGLEWPSLTCQWLPPIKELNDGNKVGAIGGVSLNRAEQHELLLGTHTTGDDPNYLMIASVNLPREDAVIDNRTGGKDGEPVVTPTNGDAASAAAGDEEAPLKKQKTEVIDAPQPATNYNEEKGELGGYSSVDRVGKIDIRVKIPHDGEVNRARYMPQNHFVVATRGPGKDVYVYDVSRHPSEPKAGDKPAPEVICRGHGGEGYGLSWCGVEGAENTGEGGMSDGLSRDFIRDRKTETTLNTLQINPGWFSLHVGIGTVAFRDFLCLGAGWFENR